MHERKAAYAWPGGYPLYYVTKDGGVLCAGSVCANGEEAREADENDPQWFIIGREVNYEDTELYCDHCNKRIESAYGEDERRERLAKKDAETASMEELEAAEAILERAKR